MRFKLGRPSPALVIACISLFVALGGVGYAAATGSIDGREIKNNSVAGKDIRNNSVVTRDVRTSTLRGSDVRANTLTGSDISETSLGKVPSAANADNAGNAGAVDGLDSSAFRTASASATRTTPLALGTSDSTVVETNITIPTARTVMATATLDVTANGGDNDNMNCNLEIAGVDGVRLSQQIMDSTLQDAANLAATQSRALPAGTHLVRLRCNEGATSASSVEDAALTVWATG